MRATDTETEALHRLEVRNWLGEHASQWCVPDPEDPAADRTWVAALRTGGFVGASWPPAYGGNGLDRAFEAVVAEELAAAGTPVATSMGVGLNMVGPALLLHGNERQKQRYLPKILDAAELWCEGFSEPDAGSDLGALRTRAVQDGTDFVVDGQKVWCSYAHVADQCLLLARTGSIAEGHRGLTALVVDMGTPGIDVRPLRQITGDREFNEIFFDGVRVPVANVVGALGDGWAVALDTLYFERSRYHDQLAAYEANLRDVAATIAADAALAADDRIMADLADAWIDLHVVRASMARLSGAQDQSSSADGMVVKLQWTQALERLATLGVRAEGDRLAADPSSSLPGGGSWQRQLFLARMWQVAAGTTEIARSVIAERALGLPRSR